MTAEHENFSDTAKTPHRSDNNGSPETSAASSAGTNITGAYEGPGNKDEAERSSAVGAAKIADAAKAAAKSAYEAVSAEATEFTSNVTDELMKSGETQKRRGADTIRTFAGAIEHAAGDLNDQSPLVAHQFRVAARKVEDFSDTLRDHSLKELFSGATELARRQPFTFFAGAALAGFALSRFLKSSADSSSSNAKSTEQASTPDFNA